MVDRRVSGKERERKYMEKLIKFIYLSILSIGVICIVLNRLGFDANIINCVISIVSVINMTSIVCIFICDLIHCHNASKHHSYDDNDER